MNKSVTFATSSENGTSVSTQHRVGSTAKMPSTVKHKKHNPFVSANGIPVEFAEKGSHDHSKWPKAKAKVFWLQPVPDPTIWVNSSYDYDTDNETKGKEQKNRMRNYYWSLLPASVASARAIRNSDNEIPPQPGMSTYSLIDRVHVKSKDNMTVVAGDRSFESKNVTESENGPLCGSNVDQDALYAVQPRIIPNHFKVQVTGILGMSDEASGAKNAISYDKAGGSPERPRSIPMVEIESEPGFDSRLAIVTITGPLGPGARVFTILNGDGVYREYEGVAPLLEGQSFQIWGKFSRIEIYPGI